MPTAAQGGDSWPQLRGKWDKQNVDALSNRDQSPTRPRWHESVGQKGRGGSSAEKTRWERHRVLQSLAKPQRVQRRRCELVMSRAQTAPAFCQERLHGLHRSFSR